MPRKGLPKAIIKKYGITKKAWQVYRGRSRTPRTRSRRIGVRKLVRRRRYTRRTTRYRTRRKRTIPILPIVGLAGGAIEPIKRAMAGDFEGAARELIQTSTGINIDDGTWHMEWMGKFWYPVIAGAIGHKVAGMLGINRIFARLPSPLNKLRL